MQGVYRVAASLSGVTTAKILLYLAAPSSAVLEILSARITCEDEDTSEQIKARLARVASGTVGGGDAITPKPTEVGSAASSATAKGGGTAITGLTIDSAANAIAAGGANKLAGWEYVPLPEERGTLAPSAELVLQLDDDVANSSDLTAEILYREIT